MIRRQSRTWPTPGSSAPWQSAMAAAAESALAALGDNSFGSDAIQLPRDFSEGLLARMTKNEAKARAAFTAARATLQKQVDTTNPIMVPALCMLAVTDAGSWTKRGSLTRRRSAPLSYLPWRKIPSMAHT